MTAAPSIRTSWTATATSRSRRSRTSRAPTRIDDRAGRRARATVLVALAANPVIAAARAVGGLISGSPAPLSAAAASIWLPGSTASGGRRSRCASDTRCASGGRGRTRSSWTSRTLRRASVGAPVPRCAAAPVGRGWVLDRSGRPRAAHP
ncbi:hypothetical protein DBP15_31040 [Streptomyces sp. CS065A]|nr:hypothetical protein DBP15_31040 [Streptomyces sp. CS065A]